MKVEFEKIDDVNGIITVNMVEADYADDVKKELKNIGKKHAEPGFRPGHVPAGLIEKKYGPSVRYDVMNKAVANALYKYIEDEKMPVLGQPIPFKENILNPEEKDFTLKFNVALAPKLDVKVDKSVKIPFYHIDITDEIVDKQDEHMRVRFGKQGPGEEVDATALVKGVITELNPDGSVKEDGIVVENGILAPQYFKSEDQKALFMGKKVGDTVVFNPWATCDGNETELSSMLNIDKKEIAEHKGDFKIDIKEIIVVKPAELGEEYYKEAFGENGNVTDEKSYRAALRAMVANSVAPDEFYRFTVDTHKVLSEQIKDVVMPDNTLKEFLVMNNENINKDNVDEVYAGMRERLLWDLLTEQVAEQLGVKVEEEDLKNTARQMARQQFAQYGMANAPEDAIDRFANDILKDEKAIDQIRQRTADVKFFTAVKDAVTVEDKTVSADQFNDLFKEESEKSAENE